METRDAIKILDPQFGYWAKSNGELLYSHHFSVRSIFKKLADICPSLDESEKELMEIASLVHDIGKMRIENQRKLKNNENIVEHRIEMNELKSYFKNVDPQKDINNGNVKKIRDIIHTHHSVAEHDLSEIFTSGASFFTNLLRTADHIASMENISFETLYRLREFYKDKIDFTYFSFSRFPSPTAFRVVNTLIQTYKEKGWILLRTFENGAILCGNIRTGLPEKDKLIESLINLILKEQIKLQKLNPRNFTKEMITGLSRSHPVLFLESHKGLFLKELGEIDRALWFLKPVKDIYGIRASAEIRKSHPILDIIISASGPRGVESAREKWADLRKGKGNEKLSEMLKEIFEERCLGELLPDDKRRKIPSDARFKKIIPEDLYDLLINLAAPYESISQTELDLKDYLNDVLSLDEQTNFRERALKVFNRYKEYKQTENADKGACERCMCPASLPMQPAAHFIKGSMTGASQIKAGGTTDRATCPLCIYDNLLLRRDVGDTYRKIYLRLETKVPDLFLHHEEIKRLIGLIAAGVRNPRHIARFKDRLDLRGLPFPERIEIPIGPDKWAEELTKDPVLQGDNGVLFIVGRDIPQEAFSPKDLRAQYEPLYHIMKYLGFKVSLGAEEQEGLFGEEVLTDEKGENYYLSLATIFLANIIGKAQKRFIFARNLILSSPSTVLMSLVDMQEDKEKRRKFGKEHFELYSFYLIKALKKSNVKIITYGGGDLSMEGLLKDAVFFANKNKGIPHFCIEPEERGDFWKNLTKHKAGKPVAQALDAVLSGDSFDITLERFMRNLSVKIGQDEQDELNNFVNRAKEILKRYHDIRRNDLSSFLKAKNSLISAIYILTRYQKLKEIANE